MAVAWPSVRSKLAAALPGVVGTGTTVYDGPVVSGDAPSRYLTIGYQPSRPEEDSGLFQQENGPDGYAVTEVGSVLAELAAVTGSTDVPDVWATFSLIAAWVQADMTLGGTLLPGSTVTAAATVDAAQTTSGAVQRLLITFSYSTSL